MPPSTEDDQTSPLAQAGSPFQKVVGWRIKRWDADVAELSCVIEEKHLNRGGILHGGVIATLLDAAMGYAALGPPTDPDTNEPGPRGVTMSFTVNYMGMAREGLVVARGRKTAAGRSVVFTAAEVVDADGGEIAESTGVFRRIEPRSEGAKRP